SAAAVEFDNPADLSAQTNLLGAARLVETLRATGARPHLVHVSTAYVGGMLRGLVKETLPLDPGLNWRHEAEVLAGLRPVVEEESRRPRSEEHTSELQSPYDLVCRLLLEKKKKTQNTNAPEYIRQST